GIRDFHVTGVQTCALPISFRNRIKELSVVGVFDLYENQHTYISRVRWTPFVYIGASVFHHNPQAKVPATGLNGVPFENAGEWVEIGRASCRERVWNAVSHW